MIKLSLLSMTSPENALLLFFLISETLLAILSFNNWMSLSTTTVGDAEAVIDRANVPCAITKELVNKQYNNETMEQ